MAFCILIKKTSEDADFCRYDFSSGTATGSFQISKQKGEVELILPMPGDEQEQIFQRAGVKILKEWRKGNLPNSTSWAS